MEVKDMRVDGKEAVEMWVSCERTIKSWESVPVAWDNVVIMNVI